MLTLTNAVKGKVTAVTPLALKIGQKDLVDAPSVRIKAILPNTVLDQLDPSGKLRATMFQAAGTNSGDQKTLQKDLEGVEPVSDLPILTPQGQRFGVVHWTAEQTGCTLTFQVGTGRKESNLSLTGATVKKLQFRGIEPGACEVEFTVNGSAADGEDPTTYGRIFKLKKREVMFTLEGPKVDQAQQTITTTADGAGDVQTGEQQTPLGALKASVEGEREQPAGDGGWPFPTSGTSEPQPEVTTKRSRRAAAH